MNGLARAGWCDCDLADDGAKAIEQFLSVMLAIAGGHCSTDVRNQATVERRGVGVDPQRLILVLRSRAFECGFFVLEIGQPFEDRRVGTSLRHNIDDRLDGPIHLLQISKALPIVLCGRCGDAPSFPGVLGDKVGNQVRITEMPVERGQHTLLDMRQGDRAVVAAITALSMPGTSDALAADDRIAGAATSALEQPGEYCSPSAPMAQI